MTQLLTHSRIQSFKACRRRNWFEYQVGLRQQVDGRALRMGSAYHLGLEQLGNGRPLEVALDSVESCYAVVPNTCDTLDWNYERVTVLTLLRGYQWRWEQSAITHIETELSFRLPLINPETDRPTPLFDLAGKIDGIVKLEDNRLAVSEQKTLSDPLDSDAELWRRLRIDHQITMYVLAARRLGYSVACVLYDVTRKPTIQPTAVPVLDSDGMKVVLDETGARVLTAQKKPRQTGDTAKGYVLQTEPMTPDQWGEKLLADIYARPEYYFARNEIPRLDSDLREYEYELWSIQQTIREADKTGRWYRTCSRDTCKYCPYFNLCTTGYNPESDPCPEGFVFVDNVHPELEETTSGYATEANDARLAAAQ